MASEPLFDPADLVAQARVRPRKRAAPPDSEAGRPLWEDGDMPKSKRRRLRTGGPLAWLNATLGLNSRANSVATSTITKAHRPDTPERMAELIAAHREPCLLCSAKSQGTVEDFGRRLFESQSHPAYVRYLQLVCAQPATLERCQEYAWDLYAVSPTRGRETELIAQRELERELGRRFHVHTASEAHDFGFSVDLVVTRAGGDPAEDDDILAGVQVKPESYRLVPNHVAHEWHAQKSDAFAAPVLIVWYDACDQFRGIDKVVQTVRSSSSS